MTILNIDDPVVVVFSSRARSLMTTGGTEKKRIISHSGQSLCLFLMYACYNGNISGIFNGVVMFCSKWFRVLGVQQSHGHEIFVWMFKSAGYTKGLCTDESNSLRLEIDAWQLIIHVIQTLKQEVETQPHWINEILDEDTSFVMKNPLRQKNKQTKKPGGTGRCF